MDLLDFQAADNYWWFRLEPEKEGEVWMEVLQEFKHRIPLNERAYMRNKNHLWGCLQTPENREALIDIFDNAKHCIETLEMSQKLPGFE